jgi:hypothetical protein
LSDTITDYKGVTKSWNHVLNASDRVEVPKKTYQTPSTVKRGRVATTKRDNAPNKRPRKEKMGPHQKTMNMSHLVDRHLVDIP